MHRRKLISQQFPNILDRPYKPPSQLDFCPQKLIACKGWNPKSHHSRRSRSTWRVEGGWLNDEGQIILELPVIVYSFVSRPDEFLKQLPRLRTFLHRMGRETNQGEVAFELDDRFYRIRQFDTA